jgi:TonB-linked SusC/RagA family outer membrane protein
MPAPGKLRVSFGTQMNIENPDLTDYNLLNSRDKLELENLAGYYTGGNPSSDYDLKRYYNFILGEVNRGVETDWLSIPLRTSVGQRHNLRIEGGDQALRYSASLQYNNIAGVMKESGRNTLNGGIMLSYSVDNVRFRNNTQISQGKSSNSPYGTFSDYAKLNPYWAPHDADGNVNKRLGDPGDLSYQGYWSTLPTNPLYNATLATYDKSEYSEIINNTSIEWDITADLLMRTQFGINKQISQSDHFRPADHTAFANYGVDDLFRKGDYLYGVGNNLDYDGSLNLAYNKMLDAKHNLYAAVDFNVRQAKSSNYGFLAEGFTNPRLDFVSAALQYAEGASPSGSENYTRALGFSANTSYSYNNKYFTDLVFRYDGSSQFGSKRRFAPFWSFGLGWNLHEEDFMKEISFVNRLKLRGSTGIIGSQNFSAYQAMTSYRYYSGDSYYNWSGAYLLGLGNDMLMWQESQKHNIGADIELLDRRIKVRADVYRETTKDLVSSINLPASNGFSSYIENIGSLENKGFEAQLTFVLLNNTIDKFFWSVTGSLLRNRNKVLETSQAMKDALKAIKNNSTNPGVVYEEGFSSNTIWVVPSLGIDPSNGKEVYLDIDGVPTYQWNGNNVVAAGSTEAKLFGNFSTMVRYKDFSINAVFRYTTGAQQYNNTLASRVEASNYKNQMDARVFSDRWKNPGDNAAFKGILVTTPTYKTSRFVQDENTLVLSNVNLQYDLRNKPWMTRIGLEALNITGNISEPLYLSTIRRERGTSYPFSRQFSFGFNATF